MEPSFWRSCSQADLKEPAPQHVHGRDRRELPDTFPISRQAKLDGVGGRTRQDKADDNGADRPTFLFGWPSDTGRRETDVGT